MVQIGLEEAVMEKGTEGMIRQFNQKKENSVKKKGSIDPRYTKILVESYECDWNKVEISGSGANRVLTCIGRKLSPTEREDGRINNGEGQLSYKEDIREAILTCLSNTDEIVVTYRHLLRKLGILDEVLYVASRKFSSVEQIEYYKTLDDVYKNNGHAIFWDIVHLEYNRLEENLESALNDMAKKKVIKMANVTNVAYIGKSKHETLHVFEAKKIDDMKRELREKYDVTPQELLFKPRAKAKQIKGYKIEETQYFESLGIDYVYDAVAIYINATNKEIDWYKAKELSKTIKQKHLQHAYELAVKRQNDYQNEHSNSLLEQFGGKAKPRHTLSDKPTKQEWIEFEKNNGTYADKYKDSLRMIQNVKIEEKELVDVDVEEELFDQAGFDNLKFSKEIRVTKPSRTLHELGN